MSECPKDLRYSASHEWVRVDDDNTVTIGITDHAQRLLGDLVFVELPEMNTSIGAGDEVAVVESVKTAADVYSPVAGEIIAINEQLIASPDAVNQDPYGEGWLFKLKADDRKQLDSLLDANAYQVQVSEEN